MEISQLRKIDVTLMDRLLVEPNLNMKSINLIDKGVDDHLSKIQRKVYLFEARDFPEPPINFTQFLEKCIKCIESKEWVINKIKVLFGRALLPRKWKNGEDHANGFRSIFNK